MRPATLLRLAVVATMIGCKPVERAPSAVPITTKVLLRYHPPAGASYRYVLDQTSRIAPDTFTADTGGQNTLHLVLRQTIDAASPDSVLVSATLDSGRVTSPMLSPAAAQDAAQRLRGLRLKAVFDDRQRLVRDDWSGVRRLPGVVGDQLQLVFRAAALALPDEPVGTGDWWTNTVVLPFGQVAGGAPLIAKTRVQVRELSVLGADTLARLGVETGVPDRPLRFTFGGQAITVRLAGTVTGEQLFSLTRGALVEANLGGSMRVQVTGGMFGSQGMAMRVDQQGTMRLLPP
jgi:hypothetical protein